MQRGFKIAIYSVPPIAVLVPLALWFFSGPQTDDPYLNRTVQLSNAALLRIHGKRPFASSDPIWELSYRSQSGWERVDDWQVEGRISWHAADMLACPVGKLVVVARTDGSMVFVRTEQGEWKTFHMEIPKRAP